LHILYRIATSSFFHAGELTQDKNKNMTDESFVIDSCRHCGYIGVNPWEVRDHEQHCDFKARLQSEETMLAPTPDQMVSTNEVTTSFYDTNPGESVGNNTSPLDYELADAQVAADLKTFLSRPVRIISTTWAQSDPVGLLSSNNRVWSLFLNNATIKRKLENYAFLRGNLKLKIITNASPFLYGSLRASYQPLPDFKQTTIQSAFPYSLVPYSQRPGVWITPAHSEGAEFTCPFMWPKSFIRTLVLAEANRLGSLDLVIYRGLQSANGSSSGVTVQVYAWMEDVVLAGPTIGAALQADEYGVGVVSAPASAVAAAASRLTSIPVIGRFAKATEIGASAVSNIAKLFGFTNVPVIDDAKPVRNSPFPSLASAEIGYPHDKLALDAKNELSIDPKIVGLDGEDELAISSFVQRESYLVDSTWTNAMAPDTPLFTSAVMPNLTYVSGNAIDFTPMSLVSNMFRNWRGDIIYRFRFIASPFHKGRVRISYDPQAPAIQTTGDTGPAVLNRIVDLGAETDIEFRIPYQQALPWCYTQSSPNATGIWTTSSTPSLSLTDTFHNGIISVKVLTALTGPSTTASIGMQVFVKGAENLEFANPSSSHFELTPFALQSEEYYDNGKVVSDQLGASTGNSSHRALVNFGESVKSLRTLMRRHNLLDTITVPAPTANTAGAFTINQTRFPAFYGYDPAGWNRARGVVVPTSNFDFNFAYMSPWHLISNCFVAQRGSMNWIFNPTKGSQGISSRVLRRTGLFPGYERFFGGGPVSNTNTINYSYWTWIDPTTSGASLTHTSTTNGHAIVAPSFSPFKFQSTDPRNTTDPGNFASPMYDGTVYDHLEVQYPYRTGHVDLEGVIIERYFGIGADYTLHFFLNCPTLWYLPTSSVLPT
jgi:hypothetical protein